MREKRFLKNSVPFFLVISKKTKTIFGDKKELRECFFESLSFENDKFVTKKIPKKNSNSSYYR